MVALIRLHVVAALLASDLGCSSRALEVSSAVSIPETQKRPPSKAELRELVVRLRPLHGPPDPPRPGSWLAHVHEPGQTFEEYLEVHPIRPREARCALRRDCVYALYLAPIGRLGPSFGPQMLSRITGYLSTFFCLPVKVTRPLSVPTQAERNHPQWGIRQLNAWHLLSRVLSPRLPKDATGLLGLTSCDLYPRRNWNYVFGLASFHRRVAVVSTYRMKAVIAHSPSHRTTLLRMLRITTHETAHMLAIRHCIKHRCNMGGMNYTGELDRRPLALCPECLAKVLWATGCDPVVRYRRLARFFRHQMLTAEAARFEQLLQAITAPPPTGRFGLAVHRPEPLRNVH